jgi:hypothetical protein
VSGYSENPGNVRVDRFKRRSGKWYDTFSVDMNKYWQGSTFLIHEAVEFAIEDRIGTVGLDDWIYVVTEPYHEHAHPVMLKKFEPDE